MISWFLDLFRTKRNKDERSVKAADLQTQRLSEAVKRHVEKEKYTKQEAEAGEKLSRMIRARNAQRSQQVKKYASSMYSTSYRSPARREEPETDNLALSMTVGAATNSTLLGYVVGGSLIGAALGDAMVPNNSSSSCFSSYASSSGSSSSYESSASCSSSDSSSSYSGSDW